MTKFNPKIFTEDHYYASVKYEGGTVDAFHVYLYMGSFYVFDYEFDFVCKRGSYEAVQSYLNHITKET